MLQYVDHESSRLSVNGTRPHIKSTLYKILIKTNVDRDRKARLVVSWGAEEGMMK